MQPRHLRSFDFRINAQRGDRPFFFGLEAIHADDDLLAGIHGLLIFVRGFLDFLLDVTGLDGAQHPAHGVNLRNVIPRTCFDFVGQFFDGVRACHRIDRIHDAGFLRDDLLGAQRKQRGLFGGEREGFVQRVGVQRLAAAEHRRKRLQSHAHQIIFRLLRGERRAGGLRVETQHQ